MEFRHIDAVDMSETAGSLETQLSTSRSLSLSAIVSITPSFATANAKVGAEAILQTQKNIFQKLRISDSSERFPNRLALPVPVSTKIAQPAAS